MGTSYRAKTAYQDADVAAEYDAVRFSTLKGRITNALEQQAVMRALASASLPAASSVLDVPCGTGRATLWLLEQGYSVTGMDISSEMIAQAQSRLDHFANLNALLQGDASKLQFADAEFDCVVSVRLFGHTPPDSRVDILREFTRVSKKWVIATFMHSQCIAGYSRAIRAKLLGRKRVWYPETSRQMQVEAQQAGLTIVEAFPIARFISETWVVLCQKRLN